MNIAKTLLKQRYLEPLKENPITYIGVELEYPIVNLLGETTDIALSKRLMEEIVIQLGFSVEKIDRKGSPIQLKHINGDCILFEVSYNTLEFAFAKAVCIQEIEERLNQYLAVIQRFLRKENHELQGKGINPNWKINDNQPVSSPRYEMLMNFLSLAERYPSMHSYSNYGAFICGNQVQLDVPKDKVFRVLNAFNKIEAVKAYLFSNSAIPELFPELTITRDLFWEQSMHGKLNNNIGLYSQDFTVEEEYLSYMEQSAMFHAERDGIYYYFDPISVAEYFQQAEVIGYGPNGQCMTLRPHPDDIILHRSYHYQELTARGTIEFRSICAQPLNQTFAPIAFHLGLFENFEEFEKILDMTPFFQKYGKDYKVLRRNFSCKVLTNSQKVVIRKFSNELLLCAIKGLEKRQRGEEQYLSLQMIK
ncbi:gamma-glutamylcysteine synthetase [Streptococcus sp. zg-86]|uniref:glutamate--cysteine ligase n=1 Tax=Streptococcus zhangguiae TaxID=2664091 RepID=A0A6I4RUX4_9STRE|nr:MULTISPECIES: gamma-glutamylcysteine synthetase [unclassified Streptococcus]MTB65135.1 gamma-glutamylcysteine synthetase [Streptococcus sp. zg-86]MTB91395.1 gamma-glutamylcysteine synthetase [Streptococcus sp. zg-36]MWV57122.1 gamma-glutamylcysteine synthetase [Streptococcus sp. zg-70]QTH47864.1 gamma-glutamylcysteine synthetase [Streptococcus sp. zg-86]